MRQRVGVISAAVLLLAMLVVAGWPVYVDPRRDPVPAGDPADVVLALGGFSTDTAFLAQRMVRDGSARQALISNPYGPYKADMVALCRDPGPGVSCFDPRPGTTRGEARELGRLARENGWDDVVVVTSTYHVSRARFIVGRCFDGRLRMVTPDQDIPLRGWVKEYAYQTVGYVKAAFQRGC